jgi:uncharacterized membrane protein
MSTNYLWLKFLHIFVAVVALGTSAGLGIFLEVFGSDRTHGAFVLRAIERMIALVVFPGYVLVLASGLWMANLAWPFTARWIQLALGLWIVGLGALGWSLATLRKQRRLHATEGSASTQYWRASFASRVSGGAFGLVVVATLYLMVVKP